MRRLRVAPPMSFGPEEVARVARLARLRLDSNQVARLATDLAAITAQFGDLADFAADLPLPPEEPAGEPRPDEAAPPDPETAREVLATAARVDPNGALRVPRGRP
ncbi:MAG: hypothetical protein QOE90_1464 [Thermoplasmata archaeon]|nr:hypothetical protein [Thermoplasmata archaeon]